MTETQKDRKALQEAALDKIRNGTATAADRLQLFRSMEGFIGTILNKYRSSLRFVADRTGGKQTKISDDLDDLKQSAYIAIMDAAENYDPSEGAEFHTYAALYIHGVCNKYLASQYGVKRGAYERRRSILRYEREYMAEFGKSPTDKEICRHFRFRPKTLEFLRSIGTIVTLDAEVDDGITLADTIADPVTMEDKICDALVDEQVRELLWKFVTELPENERKAVILHYYREIPRNDCAKILGISSNTFNSRLTRAVHHIGSQKHLNKLGRFLPERLHSSAYDRGDSTARTAILALRFQE